MILDTRNHPLLVHDDTGKAAVTLVCALVRCFQQWALTAVYAEGDMFAGAGGSEGGGVGNAGREVSTCVFDFCIPVCLGRATCATIFSLRLGDRHVIRHFHALALLAYLGDGRNEWVTDGGSREPSSIPHLDPAMVCAASGEKRACRATRAKITGRVNEHVRRHCVAPCVLCPVLPLALALPLYPPIVV